MSDRELCAIADSDESGEWEGAKVNEITDVGSHVCRSTGVKILVTGTWRSGCDACGVECSVKGASVPR